MGTRLFIKLNNKTIQKSNFLRKIIAFKISRQGTDMFLIFLIIQIFMVGMSNIS